ncbi:MAG: hypothetical protein R8M11_05600 [Gallionella sp.]
MYYRLNGFKFDINLPFKEDDGTQHGYGVLTKRQDIWEANGITEHPDEPIPDYALNHVVENLDGTYTETPKTAAELDAEVVADKANALAEKLEEVRMIGRIKRAEIVADASPYEAASWSLKRVEAMAYNTARAATPPTHSPTLAPMLAVEATVRGVTLDVIVDRVLVNSNGLSQAEAAIAGSEGKHSDAIKALANAAEVRDYDETVGWAL